GALLLVRAGSGIGGAKGRHLGAVGVAVVGTTRRPEQIAADRPYLDLAQPLNGWMPPADVEAACIFAAVARLQTCDSDPAGSSYVNVGQTVALTATLLRQGIPVLFLSSNQVFDGSVPCVPADAPGCSRDLPADRPARRLLCRASGLSGRAVRGRPAAGCPSQRRLRRHAQRGDAPPHHAR